MSNEPKHTATPITAKDFLQNKYPQLRGHFWNSNPNIDDNWVAQMMDEYSESLRAENAELIEALRSIITNWDASYFQTAEFTAPIINQARTTLAKYEKP